jgi:hypothetical protein
VKLVTADEKQFSFQMDRREKHLLFQVLRLYPLVPVAHHRLSRSVERPEDQVLLEAALAAQRREHQKLVLAMLQSKSRFRENQQGYRFSLQPAQMEWLLQVLNDVRVGSWLALGSPDGLAKAFADLDEKTAPHFYAMEVAGFFQMVLLAAVNGGEGKTKTEGI